MKGNNRLSWHIRLGKTVLREALVTIEENIFKRAEINKKALAGYGFRQEKGFWILERLFMNGDFKAVICIDSRSFHCPVLR